MVASHGRLDDTGAVVVTAADERQLAMARMRMERGDRIVFAGRRPSARATTGVPGDRIANHRPNFVVSHRS
jgi:hypothetical protein